MKLKATVWRQTLDSLPGITLRTRWNDIRGSVWTAIRQWNNVVHREFSFLTAIGAALFKQRFNILPLFLCKITKVARQLSPSPNIFGNNLKFSSRICSIAPFVQMADSFAFSLAIESLLFAGGLYIGKPFLSTALLDFIALGRTILATLDRIIKKYLITVLAVINFVSCLAVFGVLCSPFSLIRVVIRMDQFAFKKAALILVPFIHGAPAVRIFKRRSFAVGSPLTALV